MMHNNMDNYFWGMHMGWWFLLLIVVTAFVVFYGRYERKK